MKLQKPFKKKPEPQIINPLLLSPAELLIFLDRAQNISTLGFIQMYYRYKDLHYTFLDYSILSTGTVLLKSPDGHIMLSTGNTETLLLFLKELVEMEHDIIERNQT